MLKITNKSKALQGVNTVAGTIYLKPGESRDDVTLSDSEADHVKSLPFLSVEAIIDLDGDGVADSSDRDDLKKQASELGIEFPKNIPTDKLKALVDAKLAA